MISQANPNDVAELNVLINSAYRGETSKKGWTTEADLLDGIRTDEEKLREHIQKPGSMILKYADDANRIIGCVLLEKQNEKLYLGMLTIRPDLQGKGIGKELLKVADDEAKKQKCTTVYMTVITDRKELIAWYVKHGYVNTGKKKPFPEDDPRFGIPKKKLEFVVLEKNVSGN